MKGNKTNLILILILASIFVFAGCDNIRLNTFKDTDESYNIENNEDASQLNSSDEEALVEPDNLVVDDTTDEDDELVTTIIQPIKNTELLIYVVNSSTDLDPITALVPADSQITPELIVATVVDSMADQSLVIGVESVTTQDDIVIVSFYSDKPPLRNVGSGLEDAILNAIAQSLLDNLDDYHKVIYRVEGGPYASGHIELGLDEIYFEDAR